MITGLYFIFVALAALLALNNWRLGVLLMLVAGALQDPVRKLMPGAPGWMVLAFTPIMLAICFKVFLGPMKPWAWFSRVYPDLRKLVVWFLLSLFLGGLVVVAQYGFTSLPVALIGLLGYLFPLLAILIGFLYVRTSANLTGFIKTYCVLTGILLIGGILEYWDMFSDWPAIGTEVLQTRWIRHVPGYIVELTSGFYRSPDLLGWHAGLLVMFSLLMAMYYRRLGASALWIALASWGGVILLISGRNKMIFMPPIFVAVVALGYLYKGRVGRSVTIGFAVVIGFGLFLLLNQQVKIEREYFDYLSVGTSTAAERLAVGGMGALTETYRQSGFFGEGLGTASTGARFGGKIGARTWQETGPSKVLVELGVTGFVVLVLLGAAIARALWRALQRLPSVTRDGLLFVGLLGIMAANLASFMISHQAFGDPFLVTLAGFLLGLTLSAPRWAFAPGASR